MNMHWTMSYSWDAGVLEAEASSNSTGSTRLAGQHDTYGAVRPPLWVGRAQRVAWADRDLAMQRVQKLSAVLSSNGRINREAATAVRERQSARDGLVSDARAKNITIDRAGTVKRSPSASLLDHAKVWELWQFMGSVSAVGRGIRDTDRHTARQLNDLAGSVQKDAKNLEAVDRMNRILTSHIDGALVGASWDLEADYKAIAEQADLPWNYFVDEDAIRFALEQVGEVPEWLRDYLYDGEMPTASEVAAFHAYNGLLGGEVQRFRDGPLGFLLEGRIPFDIGDGFGDDGSPFSPELARLRDVDRPLRGLPDLMGEMTEVYNEEAYYGGGRGSVLVHVIPGDPPRFVAVIPGTSEPMDEAAGWHGSKEGTDWAANLKLVGYGTSAATQSAMAAIDAAVAHWEERNGVTLDRPIVAIAGHSQGGIISATIAEDRAFTQRNNVEYIFTAGSPIGHTTPASSTSGLNVGNETDFVPALDGHSPKRWTVSKWGFEVELAGPNGQHNDVYREVLFTDERYGTDTKGDKSDIQFGHEQDTYIDRIGRAVVTQPGSATSEELLLQSFEHEMQEFFTDAETHSVYEYKFGRN